MLLKDFLSRVQAFDPTKAPSIPDKVLETDQVVGELSPELIMFYGAVAEEGDRVAQLNERIRAQIKELGGSITEALYTQFNGEYRLAKDRYAAFASLFWAEIKGVFPQLAEHEKVALRKGFKVVIIKDEKCDCPFCRSVMGSLVLATLMSGGENLDDSGY